MTAHDDSWVRRIRGLTRPTLAALGPAGACGSLPHPGGRRTSNRAPPPVTVDAHAPAMALRHRAHDRQAEPGPAAVGSGSRPPEEPLEDPLPVLLRDAGPSSATTSTWAPSSRRGADRDDAVGVGAGVGQQVADQPRELVARAAHRRGRHPRGVHADGARMEAWPPPRAPRRRGRPGPAPARVGRRCARGRAGPGPAAPSARASARTVLTSSGQSVASGCLVAMSSSVRITVSGLCRSWEALATNSCCRSDAPSSRSSIPFMVTASRWSSSRVPGSRHPGVPGPVGDLGDLRPHPVDRPQRPPHHHPGQQSQQSHDDGDAPRQQPGQPAGDLVHRLQRGADVEGHRSPGAWSPASPTAGSPRSRGRPARRARSARCGRPAMARSGRSGRRR